MLRPMVAARDFAKRFLLRDEFWTAESAPISTPRDCEPGSGQLAISDTGSNISIIDGRLYAASGTSTWGQTVAESNVAHTATIGLAVLHDIIASNTTSYFQTGFLNSGTLVHLGVYFQTSAALYGYFGGASPLLATYQVARYQVVIVDRSVGCFVLIKGGSFVTWTLLWVRIVGAYSSVKSYFTVFSGSDIYLDRNRVAQLPDPWDSDYGIADETYLGTVSSSQVFTHQANCLVTFTLTTLPSTGTKYFYIRSVDDNNGYYIELISNGDLVLTEFTSPSSWERGRSNGALSNGDVLQVICDGNDIRIMVDDTEAITYSSANYATATRGKVYPGTDAVLTDLAVYPRQFSGSPLEMLEEYLI